MNWLKLVLAAPLLLVAGCATEPVTLRHPETGETLQCGPYSYNFYSSIDHEAAVAQQRLCMDMYLRQGYQPVQKETRERRQP